MKKISFVLCYILLPAAAAIGMRVYLERKKRRITRKPERICLRPVKWKLFLEQ